MLLNNEWINQEIKKEFKKYLETNENEGTTVQDFSDAVKMVLRGKFMAIQPCVKKEKKKKQTQINNLTLHVKELEKRKTIKTKTIRRKRITNIRAEIFHW